MPLSSRQWERFEKSQGWRELAEYWNEVRDEMVTRLTTPENSRESDMFIKGQIFTISEMMAGPTKFIEHTQQTEAATEGIDSDE